MSISRQLFQLQEYDAEIASEESLLANMRARLGESQAVLKSRAQLEAAKNRHAELAHRQHTAEWEMEELEARIKHTEDELYGGKVANPKELGSLQQEAVILRKKRDAVETTALEIIEQAGKLEQGMAAVSKDLARQEADWASEQEQLEAEIRRLEGQLAGHRKNREAFCRGVDKTALSLYERIRQQRGNAVTHVEQGTCRGCRISVPSGELQRVRTGALVQCGSCGRILYQA